MSKFAKLIIGFSIAFSINAKANTDSLLLKLDQTLTQKKEYTQKKLNIIAHLKKGLHSAKSVTEQYQFRRKIFEEYKGISFDSSLTYANRLQEEAIKLHDPAKIGEAKINHAFILLSAGMFTEAKEVVDDIDTKQFSEENKVTYFILKARYYYDLCDFVRNANYCKTYSSLGNQFADSAINLSKPKSYDYHFISGLRGLRSGNLQVADLHYSYLIKRPELTDHQYAIIASTLSYVYEQKNEPEKSADLLIKAAIADTKSATKENVAMFKLADYLFRKNDNKRAYRYIQEAMADAEFYSARHRQFAVGTLLPIIGGKQLRLVEQQRSLIFKYAAAVTFLILVIVVFIFITVKQNKKLKLAQEFITKANSKLLEKNAELTSVNLAIREANRIKDEYIGYYFNVNSEYIDKIERFKKSVSQRLAAKRYDDIAQIIERIDLKAERENLSFGFDKAFIKLFPNFVAEFNKLFTEEDQAVIQKGQILNPELRIFALIRLGIHNNDRIAKILNFSVNTVYSYKTRIKSKSFVSNEQFEDRIMEIKGE